MDRQSRERLHLDRRLIRRRGHMSQEELERALAALPDVASKSVPIQVEEPGRKPAPEPEKR
jgi:lipase chaperone LimK